jgi:hypothetical protein
MELFWFLNVASGFLLQDDSLRHQLVHNVLFSIVLRDRPVELSRAVASRTYERFKRGLYRTTVSSDRANWVKGPAACVLISVASSFFSFVRKFSSGFSPPCAHRQLYVLTALLSLQCQWSVPVFWESKIINIFMVFLRTGNF